MPIEERTARLTVLIDPRKKAVFEELCAEEDVTPSQMVRRLIREYIERKRGVPWRPDEVAGPSPSRRASQRRPRR
jgi:Ribbon-helix-helix protein